MSILIKNGYLINPATKTEGIYDILIVDDKISKIGKNISYNADEVINAKNLCIMPGFIDLHAHLRDPGLTEKEDIITGSLSAAKGGFTTICAMPNTKPVVDCIDVYNYVYNKAMSEAVVNVIQIMALTKGQKGCEIIDFKEAHDNKVLAVSEDGGSVKNAKVLYDAMLEASKYNILVMDHTEDIDLRNGGVMNYGEASKALCFKGIPNITENSMLARDLEIAESANARFHACHLSTRAGVRLMGWYKSIDKNRFTCEVTPHHFTLTDDDITSDDANYKMNPPLRSKKDVEAIKEGLKNGTIDVIATDHAPHTNKDKANGFYNSAFGIVGFETALSLSLTELYHSKALTLMQIAEKMSYNPSRILGINKGDLREGKIADIVIFDKDEEVVIDKNNFLSKSKNTPFHNRRVKGTVKYTIVNGKVVYTDDNR